MLTRRFFLKSSGLAFVSFGLAPRALVRSVYASEGSRRRKTLVVVFQRGACDGRLPVSCGPSPEKTISRSGVSASERAACASARLKGSVGFSGLLAIPPHIAPERVRVKAAVASTRAKPLAKSLAQDKVRAVGNSRISPPASRGITENPGWFPAIKNIYRLAGLLASGYRTARRSGALLSRVATPCGGCAPFAERLAHESDRKTS